ncbi:hypothetical protein Bca101_041606 [Brassica carinata]
MKNIIQRIFICPTTCENVVKEKKRHGSCPKGSDDEIHFTAKSSGIVVKEIIVGSERSGLATESSLETNHYRRVSLLFWEPNSLSLTDLKLSKQENGTTTWFVGFSSD